MRLWTSIRHDMRLQLRHGFYYAWSLITAIYVVILRALPEAPRKDLAPVVLLTDPAVFGLLSVGAIVLLERGDRTLETLFVTPLRLREYLISKVLSLTVLAVLSSAILGLATVGPGVDLPLLGVGVALTSFAFVLAGLALVSRCRRVTTFFFLGGCAMGLALIPLVEAFEPMTSPALAWLPAAAALSVLKAALGPSPPAVGEVASATATLTVWVALAYLWADRWFRRFVVEGPAGPRAERAAAGRGL